MNRMLIGAALVAALSSPALADKHVAIAFRNPVHVSQTVERAAFGAMVAAQTYDALNSGWRGRSGHWREVDWQYRPMQHCGALGYAASFAAWDFVEITAARLLHVPKALVEASQAEQSVVGIIHTNSAIPVFDR